MVSMMGSSAQHLLRMALKLMNVTHVLVLTVFGSLVFLLMKRWKARKIYESVSKIEGPRAYPVIGSALPFLRAKTSEDVLNIIHDYSVKYPTRYKFWLGNHLFFATTMPDDYRIICSSSRTQHKSDVYRFLAPIGGDGLITSSGPKWRKMRKLLQPAFNQKILDTYVSVFSEISENLVRKLETKAGTGCFDLFAVIDPAMLDIVCQTTMGIDVKTHENGMEIGALASRGLELCFFRMFKIHYHLNFIYRMSRLGKEEDEVCGRFQKIVAEMVRHKTETFWRRKLTPQNGLRKRSFLDMLLEISRGENLSEKDIRDQVQTVMVAGSDTTTTTACFTLLCLGMHPEIQDKVYGEVLNVAGPSRQIEKKDLSQMKYTEMVVKETLRLFPSIAMIAREVVADVQLDDITLPEGTHILMNIIATQRNPKYWPEPLKFDPERFLPEEVAKRPENCWLPFSGGYRSCIGFKYALMALITMTASIVRRYKISSDYKTVEEVKLTTHLVLQPLNGFNVSFERRD